MAQPDVTIIDAYDWSALYIDGKKVDEGHSLQIMNVLKAVGIDAKSRYLEDPGVDGEWQFTDRLEDVAFKPYPDIEKK